MRKHGLRSRQFHARKTSIVNGVIDFTSAILQEWRQKEPLFKREVRRIESQMREIQPGFVMPEKYKLQLYRSLK